MEHLIELDVYERIEIAIYERISILPLSCVDAKLILLKIKNGSFHIAIGNHDIEQIYQEK